jgi:hypothetical protein
MKEKSSSRRFFDSARVSKAVGIPSIYLNKFVERKRYGIEPTILGEGRGSRRVFSERDVYGIALVWWCFEGGLRSETIQYVLNQVCGGKQKATATEAALVLRNDDADILAIKRQPRIGLVKERRYPKQDVILMFSEAGFFDLFERLGTASLLFVPIEKLFNELEVSMQEYGVSV